MFKTFLSFGVVEGLARGINWLLLIAIAGLLPVAEYGVLSLIITVETIVVSVMLLGQDKSILRYYADKELRLVGILKQITKLWLLFSFGILISASLYFYLAKPEVLFGMSVYPYAYIFFLSLILLSFLRLCLSVERVEANAKNYAVLRLVHQVVRGVLILLVIGFYAEADYYPVVSAVAALIILLPFVGSYKKKCSHDDWQPNYGRLLLFGAPLIIHVLSGSILAYIDRFMIDYYMGKESVGIYSLGYMLGSGITLLFGLTAVYFEPYIYKIKSNNSVHMENRLATYVRIMFLLVSIIGLFLVVFSERYLSRVFGNEFGDAVDIVPVILWAHIFNIIYLQGNYRLTAYEKTGTIAIATLTASILNVLTNILLIPKYGILGAAYATLLSYLYLGLFIHFISLYRAGIPVMALKNSAMFYFVMVQSLVALAFNSVEGYVSIFIALIIFFAYRVYKLDYQMIKEIAAR